MLHKRSMAALSVIMRKRPQKYKLIFIAMVRLFSLMQFSLTKLKVTIYNMVQIDMCAFQDAYHNWLNNNVHFDCQIVQAKNRVIVMADLDI